MAAPALRGRHAECAALDGLLAAVRAGGSQVLVLHGEAGVGKTALLDYVARSAAPWRVMKSAGIESEMELPFAGLHQLCAPMLDGKGRLPAPQRAALDTAFGLVAGDPPDLLLVGLAVLGILSTSADEEPLVCLVDDVQWLDRASAHVLAFVARRLLADDVAIVFAVREPALPVELGGLPELRITGLSDADARALFDAMVPGRLDVEVRDRIVAEARGNPLGLLELARGLSPSDLAGGFSLPSRGPLATRIEQAFERRSRSLPEDAQALLRLASAEPAGDPALLWRAAGLLGIGPDAAPPVEAAGLLELGAQVRFPHPLMRSAVYRASTVTERRRVHQALAEATDGSLDPDRKAWHRAQAAVAPEEAVASELERAADRARARGGAAAAAAFLKQATELTPDASRRGRRALAAARAELDAGAPGAAARLLDIAARCPLDDLQQADSMRLRARIAFGERRGSDAPPLLLEAARRLEPLDAALARETYLDTLGAAIFAGRSTTAPSLREVAAAARNAPAPPHPGRVIDLLVDGLATRFTDGYGAAVEPLRRLLAVIGGEGPEVDADLPWLWMACRIASEVWDDASWTAIASRQLTLARQVGALRVLPLAATYRAGVHIHSGELDAATALIEESDSLIRSVGGARLLYAKAVLLAWRGQEADLTRELAWGVQDAAERGEGRGLTWGEYATALLHNGLGHYDAALASAQAACSHDDIGITNWALVELIEASARSDRPDAGLVGLERLVERTRVSGTDWALGIEARSRALLVDGTEAEGLYRDALARLSRTRVRVHLARTHLVYGEWLRRQHRRIDARDQLRSAYDLFAGFGAAGFAERARRELVATGETVRKRTTGAAGALTPQEAQIARLARDGHTNPEIGSQLYLSSRTVEYHLRKVFTKLGISSRRQLRTAFRDQLPAPS